MVSTGNDVISSGDWECPSEQLFLVCVFNVSEDQPYTILQAPCTSTAQDIITQVCNNDITNQHSIDFVASNAGYDEIKEGRWKARSTPPRATGRAVFDFELWPETQTQRKQNWEADSGRRRECLSGSEIVEEQRRETSFAYSTPSCRCNQRTGKLITPIYNHCCFIRIVIYIQEKKRADCKSSTLQKLNFMKLSSTKEKKDKPTKSDTGTNVYRAS